MGLDGGAQAYIRDLEEHLMRAVFDGVSEIRSDAAVLLVRGALEAGDRSRAASLSRRPRTWVPGSSGITPTWGPRQSTPAASWTAIRRG